MDDTGTQEWPNKRMKILVPIWTLTLVSTAFLIWRVAYGLRSRKFIVCDYLLIIATSLNIAATSLNQVIVNIGLGRHIMDPSVLPNITTYSYYLWITEIVNIIAVAFLKWSICAWLLVLNFSTLYRVIIWLSILMVTAFNFLAPVLTLFGCIPLERNWNYGYAGESHCWAIGTLGLSYTQGVSNIITDVVYMAAPLIYLSRIQLNKRTQWGIRIVFLLSIPATICSIFKTIELKSITKTQDPTWDGVSLAILASSELSIGIIIASLPPLRKAFDHMFKMILPSTITGSDKTPQYGYAHSTAPGGNNIHMNNFKGSKAYDSRLPGESILDGDDESILDGDNESILDGDDESDRAILPDDEHKGPGIMKSTNVQVIVSEDIEEAGSSSNSKSGESPKTYKPEIDCASPHLESGEASHRQAR